MNLGLQPPALEIFPPEAEDLAMLPLRLGHVAVCGFWGLVDEMHVLVLLLQNFADLSFLTLLRLILAPAPLPSIAFCSQASMRSSNTPAPAPAPAHARAHAHAHAPDPDP